METRANTPHSHPSKKGTIAAIVILQFAFAVAAAGILPAQGQKAGSTHEQTYFSEDERLQRPVPLPPDVLNVLLKTDEVKDNLGSASPSQRSNPSSLFRAAEVHLHAPDVIDFVVIGRSPMSGADNTWFWIVRSARGKPQVVLFAGSNSLEIMASRTNGYRDIRCDWASANHAETTTYKFNGREYKLWRNKIGSARELVEPRDFGGLAIFAYTGPPQQSSLWECGNPRFVRVSNGCGNRGKVRV